MKTNTVIVIILVVLVTVLIPLNFNLSTSTVSILLSLLLNIFLFNMVYILKISKGRPLEIESIRLETYWFVKEVVQDGNDFLFIVKDLQKPPSLRIHVPTIVLRASKSQISTYQHTQIVDLYKRRIMKIELDEYGQWSVNCDSNSTAQVFNA